MPTLPKKILTNRSSGIQDNFAGMLKTSDLRKIPKKNKIGMKYNTKTTVTQKKKTI